MEALHPKKVGRVVRFLEVKSAMVVGTDGNEYDAGKRLTLSWVACNTGHSIYLLLSNDSTGYAQSESFLGQSYPRSPMSKKMLLVGVTLVKKNKNSQHRW